MTPIFSPSNLADIIANTAKIYAVNFPRLLLITAVAEVPLFFIGFVYSRAALANIEDEMEAFGLGGIAPELAFEQLFDAISENIASILGLGLVFGIIALLVIVVRSGALIHAISEQNIRRPIRINRAYAFSLEKLRALVVTSIIVVALAVLAILAFVTIVGIPAIVYFSVRWNFIFQAVVLEGRGPVASFSRSTELVRDNWWRAFGILLVLFILLWFIGLILTFTLGLIPAVGSAIASVLYTPIFIIAQTLLYYDLRARRDGPEGFGVETLARELRIRREGDA